MNKDDFDIHRQFRKDISNSSALDLFRGLDNRNCGYFRKNVASKENIETFAEEEFIRKEKYAEMRCEMPGMSRSTFLMVFSPDGSRVASTHGNHNIYITDLRSGKNIKTLIGHPRTPWCIAFHPTSDQIVASGCLGGQVRIWDLSGGSEVWNAVNQTVIASLAFHPNDRVLVIATFNEIIFWDWNQPEPFVHTATNNPKEKVRYVAFDSLGHKLITGIANSPQTRWERVRAPVPVPRQERCASPYRRRITQRLVNTALQQPTQPAAEMTTESNVPERERRITVCYRNLVREYEQLVQRYLQLYRPPTMIDRGTDPMEPNPLFSSSGTQTSVPGPSTSGATCQNSALPSDNEVPGPYQRRRSTRRNLENNSPSTSQTTSKPPPALLTPSRIFSTAKKPTTLIRGTQTTESRKHKAEEAWNELMQQKRLRKNPSGECSTSSSTKETGGQKSRDRSTATGCTDTQQTSVLPSEISSSRRLVVKLEQINVPSNDSLPSSSSGQSNQPSTSGYRIRTLGREDDRNRGEQPHSNGTSESSCSLGEILTNIKRIAERRTLDSSCSRVRPFENEGNAIGGSSSRDGVSGSDRRTDIGSLNSEDELLSNIRRTAEEEVRNRILPIIRSVPATDRPELIRLFESSREHVRMRFRQMHPVFTRLPNRRLLNVSDTTSESSSSEEDRSASNRLTRRNSEPTSTAAGIPPVPESGVSSTSASNSNPNISASNIRMIRNFNTELEELVTSLLTEIERSETDRLTRNRNSSVNTQTTRSNDITTSALPVSESQRQPDGRNSLRSNISTTIRHERPNNEPATPAPVPSNDVLNPPLSDLLFQGYLQMQNLPAGEGSSSINSTAASASASHRISTVEAPTTIVNTNTRTTNSTIYTSNTVPRRRFFSHRISAFMPTRVNYTRNPTRLRRTTPTALGRGRLSPLYGPNSFGVDELINYSERENSEDDPPPQLNYNLGSIDPLIDLSSMIPASIGLGNMYSNLVENLESSLTDIIRLRTSIVPGERSDRLSSFSERLDNIVSQSDSILRNLASSMDLLTNTAEPASHGSQRTDPSWSFSDQNFYMRDLRSGNMHPDSNSTDTVNLGDLFNSRPPFSAVASDHTYPRNPDNAHFSAASDNVSPMMTSMHLTISHVQRQARLLRQQVESIERIDRAMLELEQLQLIRRMLTGLVGHVNLLTEESMSSTGMTSVRQMMAGTRISDARPAESRLEAETAPAPSAPSVSSSSTSNTGEANESPGVSARPRATNRRTYPASRMFGYSLSRQSRRSVLQFLTRRYMSRQNSQARSTARSPNDQANSQNQTFSSYSSINNNTLTLMTMRLEQLLTDQMRIFTSPAQAPQNSRTSSSIDLREHILALRLHGCVLRLSRVFGDDALTAIEDNLRADTTAAVTQDGLSRYFARHTLSLIVDSLSRYVEEYGYHNMLRPNWLQLQGVLAMSLLLTELLLLIVVESIPPPSELNLNHERASLTSRIAQMCGQILQNRFSSYLLHLMRSLRLIKVMYRHAHTALGQTYQSRRNALLTRHGTNDRRILLGSVNSCLNILHERWRQPEASQPATPSQEPTVENTEQPGPSNTENVNNGRRLTISELINRFWAPRDGIADNQPSTSSARDRVVPEDISSNNENSDAEDDEPEFYNNNSTPHNSNLYRTNNVNLVQSGESSSQARPWNVPSVQVNDVPVTEPTAFAQRLITQRQRFAERVSELRSNPSVGLFRPRFLHPLYATVNPFDADLDDPQREQIYDSDMITTVTPNHRIQVWDISDWNVPNIGNPIKNVVVSECKIHNDASVDIAKDGTILVTLLPSGGYLNVTNRLGVYSLRWETLGQCLYTASFEQNAVSVSLSPLSRHLVVGLASRIVPSDRWIMARIFKIDKKDEPGDRLPVIKELEQNRDSRINCIRWLPVSGQGLIYATNTGQLVILS